MVLASRVVAWSHSSLRFSVRFGVALPVLLGAVAFLSLGAADLGAPIKPTDAAAPPANPQRLVASYGKLPLSFELNQGQTDQSVKFLSRGRGYGLFLTGDEAVLTLGRASQNAKGPADVEAASVLRLRLVGANTRAAVTGAEELPGKVNYLIGNDPKKWRTNVPTYAQVKYRDVYPGVDLVYYGNQSGQLEYDFIVAPGADPSAIALDVSADGAVAAGLPRHPGDTAGRSRPGDVGAGLVPALKGHPRGVPLRIAPDGDLVVAIDGSEVRFHEPIIYQTDPASKGPAAGSSLVTRHSSLVTGHYILTASNQIHFELGPYDHTKPLVIDPILAYSTFFGGYGGTSVNAIAADSSGNVYVAGSTSSDNFPTVNPIQGVCDSIACGYASGFAFISKFNAAGSALVYSTYFGGGGGAGSDAKNFAIGIAVDSSGNAYVTGGTSSTSFPTKNPYQANNIDQDSSFPETGFVTKLDAAGSALIYSTYLGGSHYTYGSAIAVDSTGNAYVTGVTSSSNFPTKNPIQATKQSVGNITAAFVTKLNAAGSALVYSTYLSGSSTDQALGIAVDPSGNAYVTGLTYSTDFPTKNPYQDTNSSGLSATNRFVTKLNPAGSAFVYSTYLGGSGENVPTSIAADSAGNAYVTGSTSSTDFPTKNPFQAAHSGAKWNAFVTKLNAVGSALEYSTYLGGSGSTSRGPAGADGGRGIAVDPSGHAYVTGHTGSCDFPTVDPIQSECGSYGSAFVTKFTTTGSALIYSTYLAGNGSGYGPGYDGDSGIAIAVDSSANAYVAGATGAPDFPTANPFQAGIAGGHAFVAKIAAGTGPWVGLSTLHLHFSTSGPEPVTVTNRGTSDLTISSVQIEGEDASDFALSRDTCSGATVAPERTCTIHVISTSSAEGRRQATLNFADNASNSPQAVRLTSVVVPIAAVSPSILAFGDQNVHTTNSGFVVLNNLGNEALDISRIVTTGRFYQTNNCGTSLASDDFCSVQVTFSPTTAGPMSGALTITDNSNGAPGSTQAVDLSGTGTAPVARVSPTSLAFGDQNLNTWSASKSVTLSNTGAGDLSISNMTATVNFHQTNNCGTSLAAGHSCEVNVTFSPTARGLLTGTLTIADNSDGAANSKQTVSLAGTGVVLFHPGHH